jgi:outer membrane biosynthesis protein TonB
VKGLRHRAAQERLGAPGIAGSAALHALVVVTFLLAGGGHGRQRLPPVYRVTLLAALGAPTAAEPAATPEAPAAAKPAPAPKPAAERPAPRERTPAVPLKPAPSRPQPAAAARPAPQPPAPGRTLSTASPPAAGAVPGPAGSPNGARGGSDVATVKTEGVEFPFPGYLHNLVSQVYRRWRPPPSNAQLEAEVFFLVHRDGSVTGLQFIQRSGSFAFDLESQGAIEAAARAGVFGALPAGYGADVLPVSFYFNPRSAR